MLISKERYYNWNLIPEQDRRSSEVKTYILSKEEIDKIFANVKPQGKPLWLNMDRKAS